MAPPYGQPVPPQGPGSYGPPPPYGQQPPQQQAYGQQAYGQQPTPPWGQIRQEVKPGVVPLRPLGLGELLDGAVGVLRRYPRPALGLSAVLAVVSTVLTAIVTKVAFEPLLTLDEAALEAGDTAALESALGGLAAGSALTIVLSILASAVLAGGITTIVGKAVLGQPLSLGETWAALRPRLLPLVGLSVLVMLIVAALTFGGLVVAVVLIAAGGAVFALLGVPLAIAAVAAAVYVYVRLSLAPCVLVLERTGIATSLRRSGALVKRDWWRVFGILLLTALVAGFVSQILQIPFALIGAGSPGSLFDPTFNPTSLRPLIASSIGLAIASTLVAPFSAAVTALLYIDRRMRSEGLDVTLTAAAAGRP